MDEKICGFTVLPFPEKPAFLNISDEEFRKNTLSAWCRGGELEKVTAALRGREPEWRALYQDGSFSVRAAVIRKAGEDIQLKMIHEPEPMVRMWLARYGTDRVRLALLDEGESHPDVLAEIARYGNTKVKNHILPLVWDRPDVLQKIAPFLGSRGLRILEKHSDAHVRFTAAMNSGRAQGKRFLESIKGEDSLGYFGMEDAITERLEELNQVEKALFGGRSKILQFAGMER